MHALLDCWYDHASTACTVESCALYFPFEIYFFKIHVFCLILIGLRNGCQFWYHTCIYCHWGQITETNGWKKKPIYIDSLSEQCWMYEHFSSFKMLIWGWGNLCSPLVLFLHFCTVYYVLIQTNYLLAYLL